jgi:hypothetical protein
LKSALRAPFSFARGDQGLILGLAFHGWSLT